MNRRSFLSRATALSAAGAALPFSACVGPRTSGRQGPVIISTWRFGQPANEAALRVLLAGGSNLDAVEQGIWVAESDADNRSVGLSGHPNADGIVQQDACIMDGPEHRAGSVAALEGIVHPISAARRVMEDTPHVMLVGEGARQFALKKGLASVPIVPSDAAPKAPASTPAPPSVPDTHDTIALLVLGPDGNLAGGCSTSGWAGKLPGRVGDSPIIGSGLYVDNEVGAAGATGLGENVMRHCGSFLVVELMRQGLHPEDACAEAIRRIARTDPKGRELSINFIAVDRLGRFGGAGSGEPFPFSVTTPSRSEVIVSQD